MNGYVSRPRGLMANVLDCRSLCKSFGALVAVTDVCFSLRQGEILGMIGPNGAGKTTLFNCIAGELKPSSGSVLLNGRDITGLKPHSICRKGLAKTSQIMEPFAGLTVFENVLVAALHGAGMNMPDASEQAESVLDFVGLADLAGSQAITIPVPAKRRLELARCLATRAEVLLLDENLAGLNPSEIAQALELLRKIRDSGKSLVVVEHVMAAVLKISDRLIALNHGRVIAEGCPQDVINAPEVVEAYLGPKHAVWG